LIGEIGQYREINPVFGKALGVLGHAKLIEPIRNLLHRGGTPDYRASCARIGKFIRHTRNAVGSIFLASSRTPTAVIQEALRANSAPAATRGPRMR
jgi:hypothetical protein